MFVSTASNLGEVEFNYSEASVDRLESFVDRLWDPQAPPSEAELDNLTKLIGAYLGEVMIRNVGGNWVLNDEGQIQARPTLDVGRSADRRLATA